MVPEQSFVFTVHAEDRQSQARTAVFSTPHGKIETPVFMPVGTLATVKGLHQRELEDLGASIILANTYHLYLRPGLEVLRRGGGVQNFMGWRRPLLTDSGGYQVYSLTSQRVLSEEGVLFRSPLNGTRHLFTPENAIEKQRVIGGDIIMAFDECTPGECDYGYAKSSMERTHRWLARCWAHYQATEGHYGYPQALFPIVQGSIYPPLRRVAAEEVATYDAPGYAIGGVCHPTGHLYEVAGWVCEVLPKNKPRYLMGVGTPSDLLEAIARGVDMFDCVMPARNGRNGMLFTTQGKINIRNQRWRYDYTPLDEGLNGYASLNYTKAYLHHLIRCGERLGAQIATLHNLNFYLWLMREARRHLRLGDYTPWKNNILPVLTHTL